MQMWDSSALWVTLFSLLTGTSHHRVQRSLFALGRSLHRSLLATRYLLLSHSRSLFFAHAVFLFVSIFLFYSTLLLFYSSTILFFSLLSSFSILLFNLVLADLIALLLTCFNSVDSYVVDAQQ
jgi:hypothetical protein